MKKTNATRRNLLKVAGVGGLAAGVGLIMRPGTGSPGSAALAAEEGHNHPKISGPLANATMNFGSWRAGALDRFAALSPPNPANTPNNPNPMAGNVHQLLPNVVKIKEGGSVNFIIGGFHHVLVYDHGTQPEDINAGAQNPFFALLIDDPRKRIYRGLNPQTVPQDRVETVHFAEKGVYLVICGVRPHFVNDNMYGFVRVVSAEEDKDDD